MNLELTKKEKKLLQNTLKDTSLYLEDKHPLKTSFFAWTIFAVLYLLFWGFFRSGRPDLLERLLRIALVFFVFGLFRLFHLRTHITWVGLLSKIAQASENISTLQPFRSTTKVQMEFLTLKDQVDLLRSARLGGLAATVLLDAILIFLGFLGSGVASAKSILAVLVLLPLVFFYFSDFAHIPGLAMPRM